MTINGNLLKDLSRQEGIRSIRDDHYIPIDKDPVEEERENRIRAVKIRKLVRESGLSDEKRALLDNLERFAQETTVDFQDHMRAFMSEYKNILGSDAFTLEMKHRMIDKGEDTPQFTILDDEYAKDFVDETRLSKPDWLEKDKMILVFNLPPILSRFWHRGGQGIWGNQAVEVEEGEVEWGFFYRACMPAVWENLGQEESEGDLDFYRLNPTGVHNPKSYYYVWEVGQRENLDH